MFAVNKDMIQKDGSKGKKKCAVNHGTLKQAENEISDFNSQGTCRRREYQFDAGQNTNKINELVELVYIHMISFRMWDFLLFLLQMVMMYFLYNRHVH